MRHYDWVKRLYEAMDEAQVRGFDYGTANCALFAAHCVDAIRPDSFIEDELHTHFTDETTARAWEAAAGGMYKLVTDRLGEPVGWVNAQRGDVCLVDLELGPTLGVCTGESIALLGPDGKIGHLRIDKAVAVWKVD